MRAVMRRSRKNWYLVLSAHWWLAKGEEIALFLLPLLALSLPYSLSSTLPPPSLPLKLCFLPLNYLNVIHCSTQKQSGEVSKEAKLFTEGSLGSTPEGQGMSTYRELCAIATDLNQPDLIYKFLHLANHQSMWNSRKVNCTCVHLTIIERILSKSELISHPIQGAAFGFTTIAQQAGERLAPYMSQIVPRLYRYTFDPNIKVQTAMRSIWNAVVKETKTTVRIGTHTHTHIE